MSVDMALVPNLRASWPGGKIAVHDLQAKPCLPIREKHFDRVAVTVLELDSDGVGIRDSDVDDKSNGSQHVSLMQ